MKTDRQTDGQTNVGLTTSFSLAVKVLHDGVKQYVFSDCWKRFCTTGQLKSHLLLYSHCKHLLLIYVVNVLNIKFLLGDTWILMIALGILHSFVFCLVLSLFFFISMFVQLHAFGVVCLYISLLLVMRFHVLAASLAGFLQVRENWKRSLNLSGQGKSGKTQKWLESQGNLGENFTFLHSCCNAIQ